MRHPRIRVALALNALLWVSLGHAINVPTPITLPTLPTPLMPSAALPSMPTLHVTPLANGVSDTAHQTISATGRSPAVWQVLPMATLQPLTQGADQFFRTDLDGRPLLDSPPILAAVPKPAKAILGTPCFINAGGLGLALNFDEIPRQQSIDLAETTLVTVCPPGYRFRYITTFNQLPTRALSGTLGKTQRVALELLENGGLHVSERIHVGTGKPESLRIYGRLSTPQGERFQSGPLVLDPSSELSISPEK